MENESNVEEIRKLMNKDYSYPLPKDPNFQKRIYEKKEFNAHRMPDRHNFDDYADIKNYRDEMCGKERIMLRSQQLFLRNYINPNTPYKNILIFHGTGTGKTCAAVAIAELTT